MRTTMLMLGHDQCVGRARRAEAFNDLGVQLNEDAWECGDVLVADVLVPVLRVKVKDCGEDAQGCMGNKNVMSRHKTPVWHGRRQGQEIALSHHTQIQDSSSLKGAGTGARL